MAQAPFVHTLFLPNDNPYTTSPYSAHKEFSTDKPWLLVIY